MQCAYLYQQKVYFAKVMFLYIIPLLIVSGVKICETIFIMDDDDERCQEIRKYFSKQAWADISPFEKLVLYNRLDNYKFFLSLGELIVDV